MITGLGHITTDKISNPVEKFSRNFCIIKRQIVRNFTKKVRFLESRPNISSDLFAFLQFFLLKFFIFKNF